MYAFWMSFIMKKKQILSVVLAVLLVLPCVLTDSAATNAEQEYRDYAIASRPYLADSFAELVDASDVTLIGRVIAQYPEVRHDMVFTYSRVQISEVINGSVVDSQTRI